MRPASPTGPAGAEAEASQAGAPPPSAAAAAPRTRPAPTVVLPGTPAADGEHATLVVRGREGLLEHVEAWDALAADAVEANPFYESFLLLPALEELLPGRDTEHVLVWGVDERAQPPRPVLCGFLPLVRGRGIAGVPVARREHLGHDYAFLRAPLVRRGRERAVAEAFLEALAREGPRFVRAELLPGEGPLHAATLSAWSARGLSVVATERAARAALVPAADRDGEGYLRAAVGSRRYKEHRRLAARLGEQGAVAYEALAPGADLAPWLDAFVALEDSGWKGREGTAFARRPADLRWLRAAAGEAHARGRLGLLALRVGTRTAAMKMNLASPRGDVAFTFKIAYDEAFARWSPGLLLELEHVRRAHADPRLRLVDSCAVPDHPMANRLWSERRLVETDVVAVRGALAGAFVAAIPLARRLAGRGRAPRPSEDA
jgi:CelD/BcsL family acetyltransferase involved in cellulose biosynthesis